MLSYRGGDPDRTATIGQFQGHVCGKPAPRGLCSPKSVPVDVANLFRLNGPSA